MFGWNQKSHFLLLFLSRYISTAIPFHSNDTSDDQYITKIKKKEI